MDQTHPRASGYLNARKKRANVGRKGTNQAVFRQHRRQLQRFFKRRFVATMYDALLTELEKTPGEKVLDVERFDKGFSYREKQKLPGQIF